MTKLLGRLILLLSGLVAKYQFTLRLLILGWISKGVTSQALLGCLCLGGVASIVYSFSRICTDSLSCVSGA